MATFDSTLANPIQTARVRRVEHEESQSFTLVQSALRVFLTLTLMVSLSALFASQVYAVLR